MASTPRRQVIKYSFYRLRPEWRRLEEKEREAEKAEFAAEVEEVARMDVTHHALPTQ